MLLNDFEILQNYGNKEESIILKVKNKKDGLLYLLKNTYFKNLDKKLIQNLVYEAKLLSSLKHPNIIESKMYFIDKNSYSINLLMEYPYGGNLSNKINYAFKNKMYLEENTIWEILTQILIGLDFLHKMGIVHRNLQSKNIFLSNQRLIKMTDFNNCFRGKNITLINAPIYKTSYYSAPELLTGGTYSFKCDIWSVGCIIYEMASLSLPFRGNEKELLTNINNIEKLKPIPNFYSKNLKSIINDMLIVDQNKRLSTRILLNYPNIKETCQKLKLIYINYKNKINKEKKGVFYNINIKQEQKLRPTDTKLDNKKDKNQKIKEGLNCRNKSYIISKSGYQKNLLVEKNKNLLIDHNRKEIKNTTYRTLRERNNIIKSSRERNFSSPKSHSNLNKSFDKSPLNLINKQSQKNYKVGAFSFYDTNINTFFAGKFLNKLQEKNTNIALRKFNSKEKEKNRNNENIKSIKTIDKKEIILSDKNNKKKLNPNQNYQREEFNHNRILKKIEIDNLSSQKNDKNLSYISRLNKSKELLPEEKNKFGDTNFTEIQTIQLSDFEMSKQNSKVVSSVSSTVKQSLNDYCWNNNKYNSNLTKSNIINQKKKGIAFNNQKYLNNINNNKSEKQNLYNNRNIENKHINTFPKEKYSNSRKLTEFYNDNSSSFNYKVLNKDNLNAIKRPINFNDVKLNNKIEKKINKSNKKEFAIANKNTHYFLGDYNTLNRLSQNEGKQLLSQKNQNIKINKNKIFIYAM